MDLVFCRPDGRPISRKDDRKDWRDLLDDAGVREARVHDARHTAATLLLLAQTQRYTHVSLLMAQQALAQMGSALWSNPTATATSD